MRAIIKCIALLVLSSPVAADDLHIAVAANFQSTLEELIQQYEQSTGHRVILSAGSTGLLYAQISNGAPFDLFFAADTKRPAELERSGLSIPGSRLNYANGRLALCSPAEKIPADIASWLQSDAVKRLAIANPVLAPYGAATAEVLRNTGSEQALRDKLIIGGNISQTFQFVASGNVSAGFIAVAQMNKGNLTQGWSCQLIAAALHEPIRQEAVIINDRPVSHDFMQFIKQAKSRSIIKNAGYDLSD